MVSGGGINQLWKYSAAGEVISEGRGASLRSSTKIYRAKACCNPNAPFLSRKLGVDDKLGIFYSNTEKLPSFAFKITGELRSLERRHRQLVQPPPWSKLLPEVV
jgi:hypothetical protein